MLLLLCAFSCIALVRSRYSVHSCLTYDCPGCRSLHLLLEDCAQPGCYALP